MEEGYLTVLLSDYEKDGVEQFCQFCCEVEVRTHEDLEIKNILLEELNVMIKQSATNLMINS